MRNISLYGQATIFKLVSFIYSWDYYDNLLSNLLVTILLTVIHFDIYLYPYFKLPVDKDPDSGYLGYCRIFCGL